MDDEYGSGGEFDQENDVPAADPVEIPETPAIETVPETAPQNGVVAEDPDEKEIHGIPAKLRPRFNELRGQAKKAKEFEAELTKLREESSTWKTEAEAHRGMMTFIKENPDFETHMKAWKPGGSAVVAPTVSDPPKPPPSPDSLNEEALAKELFDTPFNTLDKNEQLTVRLELKDRKREFEAHKERETRAEEDRQETLRTIRREIEEVLRGPKFKDVKGKDAQAVWDYMITSGVNNATAAAKLLYEEELEKATVAEAERKTLKRQAVAPSAPESPSGVQPPDVHAHEDVLTSVMERLRVRGNIDPSLLQ